MLKDSATSCQSVSRLLKRSMCSTDFPRPPPARSPYNAVPLQREYMIPNEGMPCEWLISAHRSSIMCLNAVAAEDLFFRTAQVVKVIYLHAGIPTSLTVPSFYSIASQQ